MARKARNAKVSTEAHAEIMENMEAAIITAEAEITSTDAELAAFMDATEQLNADAAEAIEAMDDGERAAHDEAQAAEDAATAEGTEPTPEPIKTLQPAWAQAAEAEAVAKLMADEAADHIDVRIVWCRNFIAKNISRPTWAHAAALTDGEILKLIGGAKTYVTTIQKFRRLMKAEALAPVITVELPTEQVTEEPAAEQADLAA